MFTLDRKLIVRVVDSHGYTVIELVDDCIHMGTRTSRGFVRDWQFEEDVILPCLTHMLTVGLFMVVCLLVTLNLALNSNCAAMEVSSSLTDGKKLRSS